MTLISAIHLMLVSCTLALAQDISHVDASTPPDTQVSLAALAAPREVSGHADIYILGKKGYELLKHGNNGFSCLIEREIPTTMEPECYDAEGSNTTLKVRLFVESQRANGVTDQEIERSVRAKYAADEFRPPSKAGIVYMLSDYNYVLNPESGKVIHVPGHLMFYAPYATEKTVGSGEGAPYIVHPGQPDALIIVIPDKPGSHR